MYQPHCIAQTVRTSLAMATRNSIVTPPLTNSTIMKFQSSRIIALNGSRGVRDQLPGTLFGRQKRTERVRQDVTADTFARTNRLSPETCVFAIFMMGSSIRGRPLPGEAVGARWAKTDVASFIDVYTAALRTLGSCVSMNQELGWAHAGKKTRI